MITMPDNWSNRCSGMICATCMYFVEKQSCKVVNTPTLTSNTNVNISTTSSKGVGRCRRRAPTLNGWPVVYSSDWCGDHKLNENKI